MFCLALACLGFRPWQGRRPSSVVLFSSTRNSNNNNNMERLLALEERRQKLRSELRKNEELQRSLALGEPSLPEEPRENEVASRASWLVGLLLAQSLSSFVLEANTQVIQEHPVVVFFLTMLVGAGGNAGNQAAVRVVQSIALDEDVDVGRVLRDELAIAFCLGLIVAFVGFCRVFAFTARGAPTGDSHLDETLAITLSLFVIVVLSILVGAGLPFLLDKLKAGPSNAATAIQVIMDIAGVLITCSIAVAILRIH